MCDVYEARLVEELESLTRSDSTTLSPLPIAP